MSHTPGPWEARFYEGCWTVLGKDLADDGAVVVARTNAGRIGGSNATLIALAPMMLEALEKVAAWWADAQDRMEDAPISSLRAGEPQDEAISLFRAQNLSASCEALVAEAKGEEA